MANPENLKGHGFHEIPASRQREIQRMGVEASKEAAKKRKLLGEAVKKVMQSQAPEEVLKTLKERGFKIEDEKDLDMYAAAAYAMAIKIMQGDVSAFNAVRDIIGEKPTDVVDVTTKENPLAGLTTEEIRALVDSD